MNEQELALFNQRLQLQRSLISANGFNPADPRLNLESIANSQNAIGSTELARATLEANRAQLANTYAYSPNAQVAPTPPPTPYQNRFADTGGMIPRVTPYIPATQNTPTPQTAQPIANPINRAQNYYPQNSPVLQAGQRVASSPITANIGNAANAFASAANRATGILAVGAIAANYARNPSPENGLRGALAVATVAFAGVPYVNAALFAVNIGVAAYEVGSSFFKSPVSGNQGTPYSGNFTLGSVGEALRIRYKLLLYSDSDFGSAVLREFSTLGTINYEPSTGNLTVGIGTDAVAVRSMFLDTGAQNLKTYPNNISASIQFIDISAIATNQPVQQVVNNNYYPANDGSSPPDLSPIEDNLNLLQSKISDLTALSAATGLDVQKIKDLVSLPRQNNNLAPYPFAANPLANTPKAPQINNPTVVAPPKLEPKVNAIAPASPLPKNNGDALVNKLQEQIKETQALSQKQSQATATSTVTQDRFKQTDCKFSCEELAKCFTDLNVNIFDGCNPDNGLAKTKQITIQVLPKDREKTLASFKELLDIRSRECSLADKVVTVPEYWQIRVGERPQAVVLYREVLNGKLTTNCFQLSIPHYNGSKNSKPNLTQYTKGEYSAIYVCKDNSKMAVYTSSEAECKRLINELEKYVNPRLRGEITKLGKRTGIKKCTVKPIRLDYFSTGQRKLSSDWSVAL